MENAEILPFDSEIKAESPDCENSVRRSRKPINPEDKCNFEFNNFHKTLTFCSFTPDAPILVNYKKKCKKVKCHSCKRNFPKSHLTEIDVKTIKNRKVETIRKVLKCETCKLKADMKEKEVKPVLPPVDHFCDICGMVKNSKALIRIHTESHLNLKCEACGSGLSSRCKLL
jgi:hypothetical protein